MTLPVADSCDVDEHRIDSGQIATSLFGGRPLRNLNDCASHASPNSTRVIGIPVEFLSRRVRLRDGRCVVSIDVCIFISVTLAASE